MTRKATAARGAQWLCKDAPKAITIRLTADHALAIQAALDAYRAVHRGALDRAAVSEADGEHVVGYAKLASLNAGLLHEVLLSVRAGQFDTGTRVGSARRLTHSKARRAVKALEDNAFRFGELCVTRRFDDVERMQARANMIAARNALVKALTEGDK